MTRSDDASSPSDPDVVGLDAWDGELGPSRPLSAGELEAIADRVVGRLGSASGAGRLATGRLAAQRFPAQRFSAQRLWTRRLWRKRGARALIIAAGATLATAAAALYGTSWRAPTPAPSSAAPRDDISEPASDPVVPTPLPVEPAPDPDGRPTSVPLSAPDREGGNEGRVTPTRAHESRQAADHLARANALRGKHQYREALGRYLYVVSEYPGSMQGRAAQLAAAAIRLEQLSDIDGAEELYRAVRNTSDGELAAQATFGLAEVARARSDRGAEARTLREFLARHAGHPLASAARRRLSALEAP